MELKITLFIHAWRKPTTDLYGKFPLVAFEHGYIHFYQPFDMLCLHDKNNVTFDNKKYF